MKKKVFIFIIICILSLMAFQVRLGNFQKSIFRSIDEFVYMGLGLEFYKDLSHYNLKGYYDYHLKRGKQLPEYFNQPLFKHPPLYPFLISVAYRLFGLKEVSALYISLFSASLMIPFVYWLGAMIFDRRTGLLAAILVAFDPVQMLCSQKIWMESTLSVFVLASLVFFVFALKSNRDLFFVLSGLASGLAAMTKYPGVLVTFVIVLYAFIFDRKLFSRKLFILGLLMPLCISVPWILWNLSVYGFDFVFIFRKINLETSFFSSFQWVVLILFHSLILCWAGRKVYLGLRNKGKIKQISLKENYKRFIQSGLIILGGIFFFAIHRSLFYSLQLNHFPATGGFVGFFAKESLLFYFGQLIEFSFVYAFAFAAYFIYCPKTKHLENFLRLAALVLLSFYVLWGNYQLRYILSVTPLLLLLASHMLVWIWGKVLVVPNKGLRAGLRMSVLLFLLNIVWKLTVVNVFIVFPNQAIYF